MPDDEEDFAPEPGASPIDPAPDGSDPGNMPPADSRRVSLAGDEAENAPVRTHGAQDKE